jgi:glutathione S-transferase
VALLGRDPIGYRSEARAESVKENGRLHILEESTLITLYDSNYATCPRKARLCLYEKGVAFDRHVISLETGEEHEPWFRKLNPKGLIPVLVHDGEVLTESSVICQYIDEAFEGPPLMPSDPYGRARARYWMNRIDVYMHVPHHTAICYAIVFRHDYAEALGGPGAFREYVQKFPTTLPTHLLVDVYEHGLSSPRVREGLRAYIDLFAEMESTLTQSNWLAGDEFSLADIGLAPWVYRIIKELKLATLLSGPRVSEWFERIEARPAWQDAIVSYQEPSAVRMTERADDALPTVEKIVAELR